MNFDSSHLSCTTRKQISFPLLTEESITVNPDRIITSFPAGINSKRLVKEPRSTCNDAFPPGRTFRNSKFLGKGLSSTKNFGYGNPKETTAKDYSCPNIVDMNNTIFYRDHDVETRNRPPRRIIDGFFPHKIRSGGGWTNSTWTSVNGGTWTQYGQSQRTSPQVGMWLGATNEPEKVLGVGNASPTGKTESPRKKIERPNSIFTSNGDLTEHFNIRKSYSAWPTRNGGSPPWLERYKIKKRSTTSYDLKRPQNSKKETSDGTTRNQEYVNLSCAYIQDAF